MLSLTLNEVQWSQFEVKQAERPMFGPVETADGYVMLAVASEKTFQSLIRVIGHPEWVADPRFAKYSDRRENWADLMDGVEAWSRTLTTEKCLAELKQPRRAVFRLSHGCRSVDRSADRPSRRVDRGRDGGGTFKVLNLPFRMSRCGRVRGKADVDPGRAHRCAVEGGRPFRG